MGYEYRLSPKGATQSALGDAISAVKRLEGASTSAQRIEFRGNAQDTVPDATVMLEGDSIYFCVHGGDGRDYLGRVIAVLVSRFGSVAVEEYE